MTLNDKSSRVGNASQIYEEFGAIIQTMIRYHSNNGSEAEDLYQDFFLSLVRKPIPKDIKCIKSYIFRAIRNDVLDAARYNKSYRNRIYKYQEIKATYENKENVEKAMLCKEEARNILKLVRDELPPQESHAVIDRCYKGCSTEEVAQRIGVDKRTVSRYLCVGLRKIRQLVECG